MDNTQPNRRALLMALAGSALAVVPSASWAARRLFPEFERIAKQGALRVAMLAADTPPFFQVRNGMLKGIDVDMANEIGKSLALPVAFDRSPGTFNEVADMVSRGEADLGISKISRTLPRAQGVLFSQPYLTLSHGLLLNRVAFAQLAGARSLPDVLRSFDGTVGVIAKSSFQDFAAVNFPKARIRPFPSWGDVVGAVERGEVVAGYRDELEVKRLLVERPALALTLRTVTIPDQQDTLGIAVRPDAPGLLAYVNLLLDARGKPATVDKILQAIQSNS